jgi:hypothetical protein
MISAKQWKFVAKGFGKVRRAVTGGMAVTSEGGIKTIRMGKNLRGGYSASTKHGAMVSDLVGEAAAKVGEAARLARPYINPHTARTAAFAIGGGSVGVGATKAEQQHIDTKRAAEGKAPISKRVKRAEVVTGALLGATAGMKLSGKAGRFYRIGRATARGLKVGHPDAIGRTAAIALSATSGGIIAHDLEKEGQKKKGFEHKPSKHLLTVAGVVGGAIAGAPLYSGIRRAGFQVGVKAAKAMKGDPGSIAQIAAIGGMAGLGSKYIYTKARKQQPNTKLGKAKKALITTHGAAHGVAVAGSALAFGDLYSKYSGQIHHEFERKFGFQPTAKAAKNKVKAKFADLKGKASIYKWKKFPKKPKALIGVHGGE